jgi:hypothetical protein
MPNGNRSTIDWNNLDQVKAYATKLARTNKEQQTVFSLQIPGMPTKKYQICPTRIETSYLKLPHVTAEFRTGVFK